MSDAAILVEGCTTYEWVVEESDALDEIAISVAPVLLAGGAPLLPRRVESDRLRLVSAEAVGQFARLVYAVGPDAEGTEPGPVTR
ncbi:hypothetical protein [Microbacterium marinum]|uniref:hypothetical protein n=1 Tax=Microbacterium marinum TaxID=421115 RepID=UPI00384CE4E8